MAKDDKHGDEIWYTKDDTVFEPESVTHLHCIVNTVLSCMEGSDEYCCNQCAAFEVIAWVKEWLEEKNANNN